MHFCLIHTQMILQVYKEERMHACMQALTHVCICTRACTHMVHTNTFCIYTFVHLFPLSASLGTAVWLCPDEAQDIPPNEWRNLDIGPPFAWTREQHFRSSKKRMYIPCHEILRDEPPEVPPCVQPCRAGAAAGPFALPEFPWPEIFRPCVWIPNLEVEQATYDYGASEWSMTVAMHKLGRSLSSTVRKFSVLAKECRCGRDSQLLCEVSAEESWNPCGKQSLELHHACAHLLCRLWDPRGRSELMFCQRNLQRPPGH